MKQYKPEEQIVLLTSNPHPAQKCKDAAADILKHAEDRFDFEQMLKIADENQVALYVMENLARIQQLPVAVQNKKKNWYLVNLKRNMVQLQQTLSVLAIFKKQGIDAIPLKGALGIEMLQEDPGLYPLSDIDVLVRAADLERAKEVLMKEGYQYSADFDDEMKREHYHISMTGDPFVVEIHWNLAKNDFTVYPEFWWEDAIVTEYNGERIAQLSWEKYILYLMFRVYASGFYPLKNFLLMVMIIEKKGSQINWDKLMSCAEHLKMRRLSRFLLMFLRDIFGIHITKSPVPRFFFGYGYFRDKVIAGFFMKDASPYLSRIVYLYMLDSPAAIAKQVLKSVFPSAAAIRLRYNIPRGSLKILPYYLLNPFIMLFKKTKR